MITATPPPESRVEAPGVADGTRRRGVLFAMCLALVLVAASMSALNLALPDLAVDLSASNTSLTWIVDAYTVALAGFVLPLGALGDRVGRRRVLLVGTAVFGGMIASTFLAVFFVPVFFVVFQTMGEWWQGDKGRIVERDSIPT